MSHMKWKLRSLPLFAVFAALLLAWNIERSLASGRSSEHDDTTTATCEAPSDDGSSSSSSSTRRTVFAPLLEKPNEFVESSRPEIQLAVRRWIPAADDDAKVVLIAHHGGCGWHSGYFDELGKNLKESGISLIAYDQVGSGFSDSIGGRRQYFDSMDRLSDDLTKFVKDTRSEFPGNSVFVLGEGFGAMIALHSILREQQQSTVADGYIMAGPAITLRQDMLPPKFVIKVVTFLAWFFPKLKMPATDLFSTFDEAFGDPRWAEAGRADPFVQEAFVSAPLLGMAVSTLTASDNIVKSMDLVDVPFFILVGTNDTCVNIPDSEKLVEIAKSNDKRLKIIDNARHLLFHDKPDITKEVINDIIDWILARSK